MQGLNRWKDLIFLYLSKFVKAKDIVVIAISNDFKRPISDNFWWPNKECLDSSKTYEVPS